MSDADCTPGREPRSVAASFFYGRPMEQGDHIYFHPVSFFFFMVALCNRETIYIFAL